MGGINVIKNDLGVGVFSGCVIYNKDTYHGRLSRHFLVEIMRYVPVHHSVKCESRKVHVFIYYAGHQGAHVVSNSLIILRCRQQGERDLLRVLCQGKHNSLTQTTEVHVIAQSIRVKVMDFIRPGLSYPHVSLLHSVINVIATDMKEGHLTYIYM